MHHLMGSYVFIWNSTIIFIKQETIFTFYFVNKGKVCNFDHCNKEDFMAIKNIKEL